MILILFVLINLINGYELSECKPLVLTPFIESNRLVEAKRLSSVTALHDFQDIQSYSGFLTVNKKYDSNLFFWFFPSLKNPQNAPVLVWLNGGPGASSMSGLFAESGPFLVLENLQLVRRNVTWVEEFSVIYIDNPVGTGFSYTNSSEGFARNEKTVADHLYEGLQQFFKLFSEYRGNDFYLAGQSYAGKYITALGYKLHQMSSKSNINFKGISLGNAWIDPITQLDFGSLLYQIGLIDDIQLNYFRKTERRIAIEIKKGNYAQATSLRYELIDNSETKPSYFQNVTGFASFSTFLLSQAPIQYFQPYLNQDRVRNAIHVGCLPYASNNQTVEDYFKDYTTRSLKPWFKVLIENYKVLLYNGNLDLLLGPSKTENFLKNLVWKYSNEYFNAKRIIWKLDEEVAGYVKRVANFTRVVVRNGGHSSIRDQPRVAFEMIKIFVFSRTFK